MNDIDILIEQEQSKKHLADILKGFVDFLAERYPCLDIPYEDIDLFMENLNEI